METIDNLVQAFLAQKIIAVVGVSDRRETGCNLNYKKSKEAGYRVYAVNPQISTFDGAPRYADLKSILEKPDAVFMLTGPKVTQGRCFNSVDLRIKRVWMLCMMGTGPGLWAG